MWAVTDRTSAQEIDAFKSFVYLRTKIIKQVGTFSRFTYFILCVQVFYPHVCICTHHVYVTDAQMSEGTGSLKLELWMVMDHH